MHPRHILLCCALLAMAGGSACAMNPPARADVECTVQAGELLPPESGGVEALCADMKEAMVELGAGPATVSVTVVSPYALAANVTVAGQALPEIRLARSDRALDRASFPRLAQSIAAASKAARQP